MIERLCGSEVVRLCDYVVVRLCDYVAVHMGLSVSLCRKQLFRAQTFFSLGNFVHQMTFLCTNILR